MRRRLTVLPLVAAALVATVATSCGSGGAETLTIYSGRSKTLVGSLLDQFARDRDVDIEVRYGDTAELAATILEEGDNSPADVFFAQDAGALGALADEERLELLPARILGRVPPAFRSSDGVWVGASGRVRTLAFNPELVPEADLPASLLDLADPEWRGKIAWAPTNGSFQAFVTALRVLEGEAAARAWLEGVKANDPDEFAANIPIVDAVGEGEVALGLVNHYYVPRLTSEEPGLRVRNHFFGDGDPGGLVNVAGVGVLTGSGQRDLAVEFVEFLLSAASQRYFAAETFEYPLVEGVEADPSLPALATLDPPDVDLSDLDDLRGTLELLEDVGVL